MNFSYEKTLDNGVWYKTVPVARQEANAMTDKTLVVAHYQISLLENLHVESEILPIREVVHPKIGKLDLIHNLTLLER